MKTAAIVVGAVALVATGIGAAAGAGIIGGTLASGVAGFAGVAASTFATIGTIAGVVGAGLSLAAGLTAKKPGMAAATGSQTQFSADPDAGIPLILGETGTAGNIVFRRGFDTRDVGDNDRQSFVSVLSLGPIAGILGFTSDRSPVSFSNGAALGALAGWMWMTTQLGAIPEASAMTFGAGAGTPPGWTASHKLSGKAAATWTLKFDTKGKQFQSGVPAPMWKVRGQLAYDPTKDSTYPGGSGPHRMADPADTAAYDAAMATWEWTDNPYLLALRYAHGFWQRDKSNAASKYQRVMGMGAPWAMIDVASFVEGRNVAQTNGWKAGGVIFSGDDKWDSLKKILQAGMGEPLSLGARISCLVNAPKVSLATVTIDDVVGPASVAATQPRRERINTITPRYRLEENNWQMLSGTPISVADHITADRGKRSKTQDYAFIQGTSQVATAARYDIENSREFGPIILPLKLLWMGYKPGDCVTATLPEVGLNAQPILLLNRTIEPATGVVTMTARSETAAKHPFALGQTTTPPPTPGVTGPLLVPVPGDGDWALGVLPEGGGVVTPTLVITGQVKPNVDGVVFEYRVFGSGAPWTMSGSDAPTVTRREITGVQSDTQYEVAVSYARQGIVGDRRIIGPVRTPAVSASGPAGPQGLPGPPGANGQTTYSHYAYANAPIAPWTDFTIGAPGTRAYEGFYSDTNPNDSAEPSDYEWREYKGPPFGLAARGSAVVAGNQIVKNGGVSAWDSDGYSTTGFRDGILATFRFGAGSHAVAGINTDPASSAGIASIDHGWHVAQDGKVYIWEGDGVALQPFTGWDASFYFQIHYDNRFVRYYVNEFGPYRTVEVGPGKLFYFDSSLWAPGSRITDVAVAAAGSRGIDGLNGANGIQGPPGANGQPSYVHTAFADSADGTVNFTTGDAGARAFIGIYVDANPADSNSPAAYTWSRWRGYDGSNGVQGPPGANGQPTYVHFAYANSPDGSTDFSVSDPTGRRYIGVYSDYLVPDSGNYADYTWSLIKGNDGSPGANGPPGANGISPITVSAQPEAVQISVDASGAPVPGALPVLIGNTAIQAGGTVPISGVSIVTASAITAVADGTSLRITAISGPEGEVVYNVSAAGQTVRKRVAVSVVRSGADGAVQQVLDITSPQLSWTSYQQHGGSIAINASASGKLDVNLTGNMRAPLGGYLQFYSKLQYRIAAGTWTDVPGSEKTSTVSEEVLDPNRQLPANVNGNGPYSLTGLAANGAYEVRAMTAKTSGAHSNSAAVSMKLSAKQVA